MAVSNVSVVKSLRPNEPTAFTKASISAGNSAKIAEFDATGNVIGGYSDERTLYILENASNADATITLKCGNGYCGVVDETHTLEAGDFEFFTLDSARFKNVSGADKGCVVIEVSGTGAAVSLSVLEANG